MGCGAMSLFSTSDARRIFNSLDQNSDGLLSLDELIWLLEKVGVHVSEDELASLIGKDGLDSDEFCYFYESILFNNNNNNTNKVGTSGAKNGVFEDSGDECDHVQEVEEEEEDEEGDLYKAFKVFDLNGDGLISSQELQSVLRKLGMWGNNGGLDVDRIMHKYDVNSDGFVDFSEFKIMMLAH